MLIVSQNHILVDIIIMITLRKYIEQDAQATWSLFFNTVRNINKQDYTQAQLQAWAPKSMDLFIWNKRRGQW